MQLVDPRELGDRALVVVDAEVDEDVRERGVPAVALHDEQRRGLLAATVAARRLGRGERLEQPFRERAARRGLERLGERVHGRAGHEDVPLRRVARPGAVSSPFEAAGAGPRRAGARPVHHADLPAVALIVLGREQVHDLACREAVTQ